MTTAGSLFTALDRVPLMAILRGLDPMSAHGIAGALADAGWLAVEVPLNRPDALRCIEMLRSSWPELVVGAGTVVEADVVAHVRDAGGQYVVAPNLDQAVVTAAANVGLDCLPGVCTPTELYTASRLGCRGVKAFPYQMIGPVGLRAMIEVAPPEQKIVAVGGIDDSGLASVLHGGATAAGIASWLYRPGDRHDEVGRRAAVLHRIAAASVSRRS